MSDNYIGRGQSARARKRHRKMLIRRIIGIAVICILLGILIFLAVKLINKNKDDNPTTPAFTENPTEPTSQAAPTDPTSGADVTADVLVEARKLASQYDYAGAIELLKSQPGFDQRQELTALADEISQQEAACVTVNAETIPHVFFHSLIVDFERCFDTSAHSSSVINGYNAWMVTDEEFSKIIQMLYDANYVILNISDVYKCSDGVYTPATDIKLPSGKKPVIFSYDDTAYYAQYADLGLADRMIIDENGDIRCEYTDRAGVTRVGNYDHVPILNDFVKLHPDFAYHNHKGTLALTGYDGVFGYRTDVGFFESPTSDEKAWLNAHPDITLDHISEYTEQAKVIANKLREDGYEFACHSWGHRPYSQKSLDWLKTDTEKWLSRVAPIVGDTDIIVYPHGADIAGLEKYTSENEKYAYLSSKGFHTFFNVDAGGMYWYQYGGSYVRGARINIDGYLMYQTMIGNSSVLTKLGIDVNSVFDSRRPTPVIADGAG